MNLSNSKKHYSFSVVFDPSDPYENYHDKKKMWVKKAF